MHSNRQSAVALWLCLLLTVSRSVSVEVSDDQEHEEQDAEAQERVAILKQINRHNDDGSYTFGYEAADGSFKIETRDVLGNVKGMFGFVDEEGQLKRVSYSASNATGFQSSDGKVTPPLLYQQIIRPGGSTTTRRPYGLRLPDKAPDSTTQPSVSSEEDDRTTEPEVTSRPAVIQTIPRARRPQSSSTTTEAPNQPTTRRPQVILGSYLRPNPLAQPVRLINSNVQESSLPVTVPKLSAASFGQYIRPPHLFEGTTQRPDPRKLIYVTRRPVAVTEDPETSSETPESPILHTKHADDVLTKDRKEEDRRGAKGNAFRRQLADDRVVNIGGPVPFPRPGFRYRPTGTDDTAHVYGGSESGNERPVPDTPFRGLFTSQPRIVQNALFQGYGNPRARIGPGGLQLADLGETRNVPGVRIPVGPDGQYALGHGETRNVPSERIPIGPDGQYALGQAQQSDLQNQLQQLILAQQIQRYRSQPSVPALSPFQQALMQTLLGGELPPEIFQQLLQQQQYPQQFPYNPQYQQYPYPPQQVGYNPYSPQQPNPYAPQSGTHGPQPPYPPPSTVPPTGMTPYPQPGQQPVPYPSQPQPVPGPQPVPYPGQPQSVPGQQPIPYPSQGQPVPPQQPLPYPAQPYPPQYNPYEYQFPYDPQPQRRFRYRARPGYISLPPYYPQQSPFNLRLPIPMYPYESPQVQYQGADGGRVGSPNQVMPTEYRDALLLRMLLAIRADQQRPMYRVTEPAPTVAATTPRPTRIPLRSVQILDPVTEEPTSKRSTNSTAGP